MGVGADGEGDGYVPPTPLPTNYTARETPGAAAEGALSQELVEQDLLRRQI